MPKVDSPQRVTQFCQIGLCNVTYNLVSKSIVNRLKVVLPDIISPAQSSIVSGRQISNNVILMHEVIHRMKKKQGEKGLMAIKLNLKKAYDWLKWSFIQDTLMEMRLPMVLVEVIMLCATSCSMSVVE